MPGEHLNQQDAAERARLQKALRESMILRELADILNSSLDLEHILQELVKRTTELCDVTRCAVWLLDDAQGIFRPVAYHVALPSLAAEIIQRVSAIWYRTPLPGNSPVFQRILAAGGVLYVRDLRTEVTVHEIAETFQTYSVLLVALVREGRPVGLIALDNPGHIGTFSPDQQQLARAIGQQATVAIDNARLLQQAQAQQSRAERLIDRARAIYQVAMTANSGEELSVVLRLAARHLVRGLEASAGLTLLLDFDGAALSPVDKQEVGYTLPTESIVLEDHPHFAQAVATGHPLLIQPEQAEDSEITWFQQFGLKGMVLVPLMVGTEHQGANWDLVGYQKSIVPSTGDIDIEILPDAYCVGLIVINYTEQGTPTRGQYAFAQDIAAQCALAIEKVRFMDAARRAASLANERANTLDAVFQAMTEGILVMMPDEQVSIRNHAAANFLGVSVYSSTDLHTFLYDHPHFTLDGRPLSYEEFPLTRALHGKTPVRGERIFSVRQDGVRRVIEITTTPLKDSQQQQIGVVGAFRDVTVPVQAEQSIHRALETFLHTAEAVSYSTDLQTILHSLLEKALTTLACVRGTVHLFKEEEQHFEPLLALGFAPKEEARWLKEQERWLNSAQRSSSSSYQRLMDGHATLLQTEHTKRSIQATVLAAPITHNQRILGLLLLDRSSSQTAPDPAEKQAVPRFTSWDLTIVEGIAQLAGLAMEQMRWQQEAIIAKANEETMREADALKDEFLAITAHEFRNPLAIIQGHSQGALRSLRRRKQIFNEQERDALAPVTDSLGIIEKQAKQLHNIVTTFLDAARLNRGQITLHMETVNMEEIAGQVVAQLSNLVAHHELRYIAYPSNTSYLVKGDPARLSQVITNLVENAIKYSPFGGPIVVALSESRIPGCMKVCVEDRGMGIPPESQARLFERFYRVPNAGSQTRGVGLGLYIVAQLIHMHDGQIHVESSGIPGEGSRFIFSLPTLSVDAPPEPTDHPLANESL